MIKCISFDLQGTITKSDFCDTLWIKIIPKIFALRNNITEIEAKKEINKIYGNNPHYDIKYYDDSYWTKLLKFDALEELKKINKKPEVDKQFLNFIKNINIKKIIISTTTSLFINAELGKEIQNFDKIYSCVDYFNTAGKTPTVFLNVAKELKLFPEEILHIGDNYEMDVENALKAGINAIYYEGNVKKTINDIQKYLKK